MTRKTTNFRRTGLFRLIGAAAFSAGLLLSAPHAALALDAEAIGKPIPHQLEVPDQTDQVRNFKALTAKNGLILLFSRSLAW
jgi:hypothetical protein